jgi:diguanylate cyclase (GGDEF)-like protein
MPETIPHPSTNPEPLLLKTFNQSGQVKDRVAACARELSQANRALKAKLTEYYAMDGVREAMLWSELMEEKVQQCANDLQLVNISLAQEIAQRKDMEKQLFDSEVQGEKHRYMAFHDVITGLANRALFNDRMEQALAQAQRHKRSFAVLYIDIDNFKRLNDTCGHDMGDKALQIVAQRLQACVRDEDTVSRSGGDEFMCLLLEVKEDATIAKIAESMMARISESCGLNGVNVVIRPSIGIAICPRDGITAEVLLKNADAAMYRAKAEKSGYCFASTLPTAQHYAWNDVNKAARIVQTAIQLR